MARICLLLQAAIALLLVAPPWPGEAAHFGLTPLPTGTFKAELVHLPTHNVMLLIGGLTLAGVTHDVSVYKFATKTWFSPLTYGTKEVGFARESAMFADDPDSVYLYGGKLALDGACDRTKIGDTVYRFHYPTLTWSTVHVANAGKVSRGRGAGWIHPVTGDHIFVAFAGVHNAGESQDCAKDVTPNNGVHAVTCPLYQLLNLDTLTSEVVYAADIVGWPVDVEHDRFEGFGFALVGNTVVFALGRTHTSGIAATQPFVVTLDLLSKQAISTKPSNYPFYLDDSSTAHTSSLFGIPGRYLTFVTGCTEYDIMFESCKPGKYNTGIWALNVTDASNVEFIKLGERKDLLLFGATSLVVDNKDLYLLGGSGDVSLFHDTPRHAALPASPGQQTTLVDMPIVKNSPPPLYGTATTMLEPEPGTSDAPMMYMLGGCSMAHEALVNVVQCDRENVSNALYTFNTHTLEWSLVHGTMAADAMPASIAALGMSVALPTPRFFHSMVISKKKLFVYGGNGRTGSDLPLIEQMVLTTPFLEVFDLETKEWSLKLLCPLGNVLAFNCDFEMTNDGTLQPSLLAGYILVPRADSRRGFMVIVGGASLANTYMTSQRSVRVLDLETYSYHMALKGSLPKGFNRAACALAYSESNGLVYIFGGYDFSGLNPLSDLYTLDIESGTVALVELGGSSCSSSTDDNIVASATPFYSGFSAGVLIGRLFFLITMDNQFAMRGVQILDLDTLLWSLGHTTGELPNALALTFAPYKNRLYTFGGVDAGTMDPIDRTLVVWPGVYEVSVDPVHGSDLNCMESADVPCATLAGAIRYYGASSHGAFVKDDRARGTYLIVPPPPSSGYEVAITTKLMIDHPLTIQPATGFESASIRCRVVGNPCIRVETTSADRTVVLKRLTIFGAQEGALEIVLSGAVLMNTTFANNMITKNGGGAAVQAESSVVTMLGVLVAHNVAHDMGGAVSSTGGLLQVVHSLFLNNTSSEAGGALSIDYTQTSVGNTVFANNTAEAEAGGLPPFGGAVRITGERPVEFDSCTFFGNRAHSGGAIHAQGSSPRFVDCLLQANEALASGGAAFFDIFSNPQFEGCGFSSNAAGTVGGALACSESQSLAIHDSHFAGNHAEIDGGGMYLASVNLAAPSGGTMFGVANSSFTRNEATSGNGGAIALSYTNLVVQDSQFVANRAASGGGGAVYWEPAVQHLFARMAAPVLPLGFGGATCGQATAVGVDAVAERTTAAWCDATGNCAQYGCYVASSLHSVTVRVEGGASALTPVQSGEELTPAPEVVLEDYYGQRTRSDTTTTVVALLTTATVPQSLLGNTRVVSKPPGESDGGLAQFSQLKLLRRADLASSITFQVSLVSARRGEPTRKVDLSALLDVPLLPCKPGQWLDSSNTAAVFCRPCGVGTHLGYANLAPNCSACAVGTVAPPEASTPKENLGAVQCKPCKAGWFSVSAAEPCEACPPGFVTPEPRSSECIACPAGSYAPTSEMTACLACPAGTFVTGQGQAKCSVCDDGRWSHPNATSCYDCPAGGVNCKGGFVEYQPGYWSETPAMHNLSATTVFLQCVTPGSCLARNDTLVCAPTYAGPLCGLCEADLVKVGALCVSCPDSWLNYLLILFIGACVVAVVIFLIRGSSKRRSALASVARIAINFLQLNATLGSLSSPMPPFIANMLGLSSVGDGIALDLAPLQCVSKATFYDTFWAYVAVPGVVVVVVVIVLSLRWLCVARCVSPAKRAALVQSLVAIKVGRHSTAAATGLAAASSQEQVERGAVKPGRVLRGRYTGLMKTSIVVIMFTVYTRVSKTMFQIFDVYPTTIHGQRLLRADLSVAAFTPTYYVAMVAAICMIVLFTIGVPTAAVALLRHNRHQLDREYIRQRYGFLYDGYKPSLFAWEVVVLCRKIAVVSVASFVQDAFQQTFYAIVLLGVACWLHLVAWPYEAQRLNRLEAASLAASLVSQLGVLWYARHPEDQVLVTVVVAAALGGALLAMVVTGTGVWWKTVVRTFRERRSHNAVELAKARPGRGRRSTRLISNPMLAGVAGAHAEADTTAAAAAGGGAQSASPPREQAVGVAIATSTSRETKTSKKQRQLWTPVPTPSSPRVEAGATVAAGAAGAAVPAAGRGRKSGAGSARTQRRSRALRGRARRPSRPVQG